MLFRLRTWQSGIKSLLLHPLRSMLTVLGIFIGTASVIWLLAIGEGISAKAQQQIEQLGADNIILRSVQPSAEGNKGARGMRKHGITKQDYENLETIPSIGGTTLIRETRRECKRGEKVLDARLVGCSPAYYDLNRLTIDAGHFLTDAEMREEANVCVLAAEAARTLFDFEDPLGKEIHVDKDYYTVIGVLREKTATAAVGGSLAGQDFSKDVYIPISTFWQRLTELSSYYHNGTRVIEYLDLNQITLKVLPGHDVLQTADAVREMLSRNHRELDYAVVVPLELLEQARATRLMFMVFMGLMAAVSLLVGGIGIMNIMLATVTERTREIGIRRALGAKRADITYQFLVETISLSVVGGLTGVLGGIVCGPIIRGARKAIEIGLPDVYKTIPESMRDVTPVLVPESIPLAFGISVLIGVVFGLYPARRAARMNPIEALRHVA